MSRYQPPWHVNAIAQAAAGIAFEAGEYAHRTIELVQQERRFLASSLAELQLVKQVYPSAANFLLLELRPPATAPGVWEHLARRGVLVRDCSNFGWLGDRFIRVAVRDHDKNLLLLERLKQLDENISHPIFSLRGKSKSDGPIKLTDTLLRERRLERERDNF